MASDSLAVFDLDGTVTSGDTYVAFLLHFLRAHPVRLLRTSSLPFAVAMHRAGLRDNTWLKARFMERILGGTDRARIERSVESFLSGLLTRGLRPGALAALEAHRARGDRLILASASFDLYVEPLAEALGFHTVVCTRAAWQHGALTGRLDGPNCYGHAKLELLQRHLGRTEGAGVTAYSDHHTDLPLLTWSEHGVAVNPTPKLSRLAEQNGLDVADWAIAPEQTADADSAAACGRAPR